MNVVRLLLWTLLNAAVAGGAVVLAWRFYQWLL